MIKTFKTNRFIVFLLIIVFFLRLPSLFEPYWYGDEGVYLTVGQALRKGLLLYRDIYDNKPPLIYIITAIGNGDQFWFKLLTGISVLFSTFLFYRLSQKLFNNEKLVPKVTTALFAILTTIPLLEGNIANAELLILLPTVGGFFLFFKWSEEHKLKTEKILFLGIILGLGFLLKATAIFDFAVLAVFLMIFQEKNKFLELIKKEFLLIIAYLTPIALTAVFFLLKNSLIDFINSCFIKTVGYLGSWETGSHSLSTSSLLDKDMSIKLGLVLITFFTLWLNKKKLGQTAGFLSLWFIFSLFGATLSGRPYTHYLLQTVPPLALIIGLLFLKKYRRIIYLPILLIFFYTSAIFYYRFWVYKTLPYYQNFVQFILGYKNKSDYFSYFSPKMPTIYSLASFIDEHSLPADRIFIWGDEPYLYSLSHRLPASSYTVAYHIIEQNAYKIAAEQIINTKPALIITESNDKFPELGLILEKYYFKILDLNNFTVFQRRKT